jgi:hypothetical protein
MRWVGVGLDMVAAVVGLLAARYWWKAAKVDVENPIIAWRGGIVADADVETQGWVLGTMQAFQKAGRLNAIAAKLTAATVVLGIAGNLASMWPW